MVSSGIWANRCDRDVLLCGFALWLLSGCNFHIDKPQGDFSNAGGRAQISYQSVRKQVFTPYCVSCHGSAGGVNLESYSAVKSRLREIERVVLVEKTMPKGRPLPQQPAKTLEAWIRAGAPESGSDETPGNGGPDEALKPNFKSIKKKIFDRSCVGCHSLGGTAQGVPLETYQDLIESPRELVIPFTPDESGLVIALTRADDKRMPPSTVGPALSEADIMTVRKWIEMGAPETENGPGPAPTRSPKPILDPSKVNYSIVRERIFAPRCIGCHIVGGTGKIDLSSYDAVKLQLAKVSIATLVEKIMPPSRPLKKEDAELLATWIKAGAPNGTETIQPPPENPIQPTFQSIRRHVLEPRCLTCHSSAGSAPGVPLAQWKDLLESPRDLVLPGNPDESGLYIAINREDDKRMPPPRSGLKRLTSIEINAIRKWIKDGAKE